MVTSETSSAIPGSSPPMGDAPTVDHLNLRGVHVHAGDLKTAFGDHAGDWQADIPQTNYTDVDTFSFNLLKEAHFVHSLLLIIN